MASDVNIGLFLCVLVFRLGREVLSGVDCFGLMTGRRWVLNSGLFLEIYSLCLSLERADIQYIHLYISLQMSTDTRHGMNTTVH